MKLRLLTVAFTATIPIVANAQIGTPSFTVQVLREACKATVANADALCIGVFVGTSNMMIANGFERLKVPSSDTEAQLYLHAFGMCLPSFGASPNAMIQAFINWSDKHPEQWSSDSATGVIQALRETWPCAAPN